MEEKYRVLLYYQYVNLDDRDQFKEDHWVLCHQLQLKGRVLIAHEGINGTVSGTYENTQRYMDAMHSDPRFASMVFKIDDVENHVFPKMKVRLRDELVRLGLEKDLDPNTITGKHLTPSEFYQQMEDDDTIVIDARNDYEYDLGHFSKAIRPDIEVFRDLPQWIQKNKNMLEGKKILTYCTGGVRCEKFSGWLIREGHTDVGQLHGGIVTYGKDPQTKGKNWNGLCYVFDDRIGVPINQAEHVVVGRDYFTHEPCERYVNCGNPWCHRRILCSEENEHRTLRGCCHTCRIHPDNEYVSEHGLSPEAVHQRLAALAADQQDSPS